MNAEDYLMSHEPRLRRHKRAVRHVITTGTAFLALNPNATARQLKREVLPGFAFTSIFLQILLSIAIKLLIEWWQNRHKN